MGLTVGVLTGAGQLGGAWERLLGDLVSHVGSSPEGKVERVRAARQRGLVAMVGDGLNDAPALAAADVGIALGTGKDLTREAAQVNIVSDDLSTVPWLLQLARAVQRTVLQNLSWALIYNALALAAAMSGRLNPVIAALAMIGSSVLIVANAQRLRRSVEPAPDLRRDEAKRPALAAAAPARS
jgi:P-type E1-E2 ATPase